VPPAGEIKKGLRGALGGVWWSMIVLRSLAVLFLAASLENIATAGRLAALFSRLKESAA